MSLRQKHDYIKQNTTYRIGIRAEKVSKKMFCPKIFLNSDFELSVEKTKNNAEWNNNQQN